MHRHLSHSLATTSLGCANPGTWFRVHVLGQVDIAISLKSYGKI